ncbi:hypothetical protein SAMN05421736_13123 [Evansella caseinilytica]|uniref:Peptide ABC transporter permease n=1 Tax=Evansella caseinilytica TaxID=1503961 RepID=A0A1H3UZL4_9BACI|nr:hypothetical protein [Evansella caseinilytica]SDZ67883.1 hypothetical protein SAMN05421736_13123 [Evansella caseinilytica]
MLNRLDKLSAERMKKDLTAYWPGFTLTAYAVFDKEHVYLFHHPNYPPADKTYHVLQWNEMFAGCTFTLFEDYPTAIVDIELYDDFEGLYAILVHELFHCFQYLKEESRFPDELAGVTYPLISENVELRHQERKQLYLAVMSSDRKKKRQHLAEFVGLRQKREALLGKYLHYEARIETIEGPAYYVESKAYGKQQALSADEVLQKFIPGLVDQHESNMNIRRSCYSSGLFLCLVLDDVYPEWKENHFDSEHTLYDLVKEVVEKEAASIAIDVSVSKETEKTVKAVKKIRESELEGTETKAGYHLFLEGDIVVKGFDPMNLIYSENKLLHKNFLKIAVNDREYLFQQPAIAFFHENPLNIYKLHLVLDEKPEIIEGGFTAAGIGKLRGRCYEKDNNYYVKL